MRKIAIIILASIICVPASAQEFSLVGGSDTQVVRPRANTPPPRPVDMSLTATNGPLTQAANKELPIPPPEIIGGGDYEIGDLVELSVSPLDQPANLHSVVYNWTILPELIMTEWPDGSKILFGTGRIPRTLNVILTVSYVFVDKDENNVILNVSQGAITVKTIVRIGSGGEVDPVDPVDPVGPIDPTFGSALAKSAFEWTDLIEAGEDYSIGQAKADAASLRDAFLAIKAQIDNGAFTGNDAITRIFEETKSLNDKALGDSKPNWQPWFNQMSSTLQKAFQDGTINTPEQFGTAWGQIAEGLAAAAK